MCDPTLIRVGASSIPTSENKNSISNARPREVTFMRHDEKSCCSLGRNRHPALAFRRLLAGTAKTPSNIVRSIVPTPNSVAAGLDGI
jgi:hypothetical protein